MKTPSVAKGFTLVELITVVVVLGIIGSIVATKFVSFNREATIAVLERTQAAMAQLTDSIYAKSIIQHKDKQRLTTVSVNQVAINTYFGAPQELWPNQLGELMDGSFYYAGNGYYDFGSAGVQNYVCEEALCVIDQTPGSYVDNTIDGWALFIFPNGYRLSDDCFMYYAFSENGSAVTSLNTETRLAGC